MRIDDGVYQISGQVRMEVRSPAGKQWWRNFEMTGYIRYERYEASKDNLDPHWEWHGRGERHNALQLDGSKYNDSVAPPPGTITPPGYDHYKDQNPINSHCLGTAYHGNIYVPFGSSKARVVFEKEISHTGGYSDQRPCRLLRGFDPQPTGWFGYKFVTRNFDNNRKVRIEIWLDPQTTGNWILAATTDDTGGWRRSATMTLDGCDAGPFFFTDDQIMTWAAPWLVFRSDSVVWDFKWLSAREISALP